MDQPSLLEYHFMFFPLTMTLNYNLNYQLIISIINIYSILVILQSKKTIKYNRNKVNNFKQQYNSIYSFFNQKQKFLCFFSFVKFYFKVSHWIIEIGLKWQIFTILFQHRLNITVTMNLQSPTSLLSSIQQMKSKLRSDKQTLIDIKNDFTKFSKKTNHYSVPSRQQKVKSIEREQITSEKENDCGQVQTKIKQIRSDYQKQISQLIQKYESQLNQIIRIKQKEKEDVQNKWKSELEDQKRYINILQNRISSINLDKRQATVHQQYNCVINKLLKENNQLHQKYEQIKSQSNQWRRLYEQMEAEKSSKSRFKFSKAKKDDSIMKAYQTERQSLSSGSNIDRVYTYGSGYGKENIDISNISSGNKWDKIHINLDQQIFQSTCQIQRSVLEEAKHKKAAKKCLSLNFDQ